MRGGPIKGNSTITVEVRGATDVQMALRKWLEPELTRQLDAANKKAAQTLARELRAELRPVSRHMARAVRVKRARTGKPGWVVGSRRKIAFFWHMVIGGTREHGVRSAKSHGGFLWFIPNWEPYLGAPPAGGQQIRTRRVKGVRANPIVERVATSNESRVVAQIDGDLAKNT